jgi:sporulation protein YlmC with PRC-barrel domain
MLKKLLLSTALSVAVAGVAFAQSPTTPTTPPSSAPSSAPSSTPSSSDTAPATKADAPAAKSESGSKNFVAAQKPDQWLASKFKGTDVVGSDNQKIGDVSDILFDKSGKVEAFIISVGGFLGVGSKEVALPPSAFDVVPGTNGSSDKLKIAATKDELKNAQTFARYEPPRPTSTTGSGTTGGGMKPSGTTTPPASGR